jgi:hypothetical protein
MKQHISMASLIGVAIASVSPGAIAQTGQLLWSGCRQGYCSETYLINQQVIHQNRLGGVDNTLYEVALERHTNDGVEPQVQWVYCSTSEPFTAFESTIEDLMIVNYLNPGGQLMMASSGGAHQLYWSICHEMWHPEVWNPERGLANQARQLGYSLVLEEDQREIPKVMFR